MREGSSQHPQPRPTTSGFMGVGSEICVFTKFPCRVKCTAKSTNPCTGQIPGFSHLGFRSAPHRTRLFQWPPNWSSCSALASFYLFPNITQNDPSKTQVRFLTLLCLKHLGGSPFSLGIKLKLYNGPQETLYWTCLFLLSLQFTQL